MERLTIRPGWNAAGPGQATARLAVTLRLASFRPATAVPTPETDVAPGSALERVLRRPPPAGPVRRILDTTWRAWCQGRMRRLP